jgi:hypothetical protein
MDKTKYGKYFVTYEGEQNFPLGRILARFDDTLVKGSFYYFVHWVMPNQDLLKMDAFKVGHPPHIHKQAELIFHIGTNPEDPMDLGAEIEFHMGEEMERHVITRTTAIFIPAMMVHAPWRPLKLYRPFIFVEVNQEPQKTEKFFPQLLPKEKREKADWNTWQDVGF